MYVFSSIDFETMKKTQVKKDGFPSILSQFFSGLFTSLKSQVTQGADAILDHMEERILALQKKMIRNFFIMLSNCKSDISSLAFARLVQWADSNAEARALK